MVFASLTFLFAFLPLTLAGYYLLPGLRMRNLFLVLTSLVFYAWGEPVWVGLLVFSAAVDYWHARFIAHMRGRRIAVLGVISSLAINLALLGGFKYAGFLTGSLNAFLGTALPVPEIALPIGISFYTFQTISYTIDVYRGEVEAQRSFLDFLLFVSLFHQLVAGPIVRYRDIATEIQHRVARWEDLASGVDRFCIGLFKKVVFANTAGALVASFLGGDPAGLGFAEAWFGLLMFALQIYFDFSGYSDMAIGLGRMFGFHYLENFRHPYVATSIREFWRRWHISLGSFFRDYVYIPLGGGRRQLVRNTAVVWALTGLWHGASWNFVLWGLYFGVLLLGERLLWGRGLERLPRLAQHTYALILILVGWALFYFTDLARLWAFLPRLVTLPPTWTLGVELEGALISHALWLAAALAFCLPTASWLRAQVEHRFSSPMLLEGVGVVRNLAAVTIATAMLAAGSYNPFLYFRF